MAIAIKTPAELTAHLETEQAARIAAEKKVEETQAELGNLKKMVEESKDKLAEVTSKNWTEKYSTKDSKEETLYNFGMTIKSLLKGDREGLAKYNKGGQNLSPDQANAWGENQYNVNKTVPAAALVSDATTGNILTSPEVSAEILYVAKQASQMMGQVREVPMNSNIKYVPTQLTAATIKWNTNQTSANTEVAPTFSRVTLTAQTAAMFTMISDEMDEDSIVPLAAYFRDIFGEDWGREFDKQCTTASSDPFTGLLAGATNVYTLGGPNYGDISFDDMYDAISTLDEENKRIGGKWILHCTVLDAVRKLRDANGQYLWQPPNVNAPATICGYPYISCDAMTDAASVSANTKYVAFGNPKYMLWGNRKGFEFKIFNNDAYLGMYDSVMLRCRTRAAFVVGVAGAFVAIKTGAT